MAEFALWLVNVIIYNLWQVLPMDLASGIGSLLIRIISRKYHRTTTATRRALLHIDPVLTEPELDKIIFSMWQNMGRVWAESLITHRLARHRLKITGLEHIRAARDTGRPIIVPFLHLGNWELATYALIENGMTFNSIAEVQKRKVFDYMLNRARASNRLHVIKPDFEGKRNIYQCLQRGEALGIALDEYKNSRVWGPRFGRKFTESTNLDFLLRLAEKFSTVVLPMYLVRTGSVKFELFISPPIVRDFSRESEISQAQQELEMWRENTIRKHIDQWYMLHRLRFQ